MKNSIEVEEILNDEITMNMMSFPGFHQNKIKMQGRVGTKWPFDCPSLFDLPLSSVKFQQTFLQLFPRLQYFLQKVFIFLLKQRRLLFCLLDLSPH